MCTWSIYFLLKNANPTKQVSNRTTTKDFEYNGSKYHINSAGFYDRILALEYCKDNLDMRVVDFDQSSDEFITVVDHIVNNGTLNSFE
jgi:hypothetical protein